MSTLRSIEREYTLHEIAIITRAGPARSSASTASTATWGPARRPT